MFTVPASKDFIRMCWAEHKFSPTKSFPMKFPLKTEFFRESVPLFLIANVNCCRRGDSQQRSTFEQYKCFVFLNTGSWLYMPVVL